MVSFAGHKQPKGISKAMEEEEEMLQSWIKVAKKMPAAKTFTPELKNISVPKIKMHASLSKIQKNMSKLVKDLKAENSSQNKINAKGRSWVDEIHASMNKKIPAKEIPSRKSMLLGMGIELSGSMKYGTKMVEQIAKTAVTVENDAFAVKKEIRKAEKQLKKSKKGKGDSTAEKVIVLGKKIDASEEEIKQLSSQLDDIQKKMSDFGSKVTRAWIIQTKNCDTIERAMKIIRNFKV